MKKLWIGLLSVAMIMAFTMPAAAVDVKFSGSYYVEGVYNSNTSLLDLTDMVNSRFASNTGSTSVAATDPQGGARAVYFQRLRVSTEFQVVEGLKLVTRFDAMEKRWGDQTWGQTGATGSTQQGTYPYDATNRSSLGASTARAQENIEFNRVYMDFNTAIGRFLVGYQEFGAFGTVFFDTSFDKPGVKYFIPAGPVTVMLAYAKQKEGEVVTASSANPNGAYADRDKDEYYLAAVYKKGNIEAGLLIEYLRDATKRGQDQLFTVANQNATAITSADYTTKLWLIDPYFKGKFGPVFLESELIYGTGKYASLNSTYNKLSDVDVSAWGVYLHARADISMFYFGGIFVAVSGDDPSTPDKIEGNLASATSFLAGQNFSPTLIFKNDDHNTVFGDQIGALKNTSYNGYSPLYNNGPYGSNQQFMDNIWFYQLYFGVKPIPKLDITAKISYAYADKKPWQKAATLALTGAVGDPTTEFNSNTYGTEVDLIATYKIYDNLEYMVGFGYFWTGDFYKGYYAAGTVEPKLSNDYLLMHKLTLTF